MERLPARLNIAEPETSPSFVPPPYRDIKSTTIVSAWRFPLLLLYFPLRVGRDTPNFATTFILRHTRDNTSTRREYMSRIFSVIYCVFLYCLISGVLQNLFCGCFVFYLPGSSYFRLACLCCVLTLAFVSFAQNFRNPRFFSHLFCLPVPHALPHRFSL